MHSHAAVVFILFYLPPTITTAEMNTHQRKSLLFGTPKLGVATFPRLVYVEAGVHVKDTDFKGSSKWPGLFFHSRKEVMPEIQKATTVVSGMKLVFPVEKLHRLANEDMGATPNGVVLLLGLNCVVPVLCAKSGLVASKEVVAAMFAEGRSNPTLFIGMSMAAKMATFYMRENMPMRVTKPQKKTTVAKLPKPAPQTSPSVLAVILQSQNTVARGHGMARDVTPQRLFQHDDDVSIATLTGSSTATTTSEPVASERRHCHTPIICGARLVECQLLIDVFNGDKRVAVVWGLTGTGKTTLVKHVSIENGGAVTYMNCATMVETKLVAPNELNHTPTILILDEIDKALGSRALRMVLRDYWNDSRVTFVAITNFMNHDTICDRIPKAFNCKVSQKVMTKMTIVSF